jgi:hypothetical protein
MIGRGRAARRVLACAGAWLTGTGCVYYNGVYNAQSAAKAGDARLRRDQDDEAMAQFQLSAERAESVLARFPTSSWRTRALYLAGRGAALSGNCDRGTPRLLEFLSGGGVDAADRDRARVALAACDFRLSNVVVARRRLDSLVSAPDAETARQARLWAARAALAQGDLDAVPGYLGRMETGVLPWELINASLGARDYARVESLLVVRATRGDFRDDAVRAVRDLASAGSFEAAERVVRAYDAIRVRDLSRGALHYALGDQWVRAGGDSLAAVHLSAARELGARDTVISRESAARLAYVQVRRAASLPEADAVLARLDSAVARTPYARRFGEQYLLVRLLATQADPTGAALYLAGEVARDSLRAPLLATGLFTRLAREQGASPLAPHAWYAASLLRPDSAETWRRRVLAEFSASAVAARLRGEDPASLPDYVTTPELLKFTWTDAVRLWADSVRKLRALSRAGSPSTP